MTASAERRARRLRLIGIWALSTVLLLGLWLALVDNTQFPELMIGLAAALFAGGGMVVAGVRRGDRVGAHPAWLARALLAPGWIVRDGLRVAFAAVSPRAPRGNFRALAFEGARGRQGRDVGRRVLAKWIGSLGPDCYVVDVLAEEHALLLHELVRHEERPAPMRIVGQR
jgi:hypothetical protein